MRPLFLAAMVWAGPALAASISGTLTATFDGLDAYDDPKTTVSLNLSCSLSCPQERPTLHFGVSGSTDAFFASAPSEDTRVYFSASFGSADDGRNVLTDRNFKAGTAVVVKTRSATCWCGNANGEGGYVDLESAVMAMPPGIVRDETMRQNDDESIIVKAMPRGAETVTVTLSGAGLDETRTLTPADFGTQDSLFVRFTPTQPGTLTFTATLNPYGVTNAKSTTVTAREVPTGGGSGGSGGGGGSEEEPSGCSSTGALALISLGALLFRRRR
ncbi:MAG: hypothetical protein ACO1OB_32560 [Archangium sp.]